ncbi:NCS2 family permease [Salinibius halmophilus]|uniref:NCS2 family permease n=1 Tax=Salinibius halmophilus TaxID=1853216 RepID=UPI001F334B91|nr:NCS2 family permease [Salinibius halmophilus]
MLASIEKYFGIKDANSSWSQEIRAGVTTFLTMSYILFVNPDILGAAITGIDNAFVQLMMVTAIAAGVGSLFMGIVARYPFALAPGMGLNAYFAFTVVLGDGIEWQTALAAVFISGVLFSIFAIFGARQAIVRAIPHDLKFAVTGGIGMFLAFIGMQNAGIIVDNPATLVGLGDLTAGPVLIALFGLVVTGTLMALRIRGAILVGIVAATLLAIVTKAPVYVGAEGLGSFTGFNGQFLGIFAAPVWPSDLVFALDFGKAFELGVMGVIFTFFFVDFFDSTGTLMALANKAGYMKEENGVDDMPRSRRAFAADGFATMFGALMGTSTTTAYIESASGIDEGGRTGVTAVVVGILFLLAMFLWPLATAVPGAATAPALILVGAMMLSGLNSVKWDDYTSSIPVFLTVIMMPLTYSIANGVSWGVISYVGLKVLTGRHKDVHPLLYGVAAILLARYIWLGAG